MFRIAITLLVVALVAAIFGFGGIASAAASYAKIVFIVALILALVSFIAGGGRRDVLSFLGPIGLAALGFGMSTAHAAEPRQFGVRHGATFGGSIGGGHLSCEGGGCEGVNEAGGLELHGGTLVAPSLGLLFDVWGMTHSEEEARFSQALGTVGVRFWPTQHLWLQGGVGLARASWRYEGDMVELESRTEHVPAMMGAVGVELLSTTAFALELNLRGGTGLYDDDMRVRSAQLGLGVSWY